MCAGHMQQSAPLPCRVMRYAHSPAQLRGILLPSSSSSPPIVGCGKVGLHAAVWYAVCKDLKAGHCHLTYECASVSIFLLSRVRLAAKPRDPPWGTLDGTYTERVDYSKPSI